MIDNVKFLYLFFQYLTHLMRLPMLTSLSLKDPLFAPAPVSLLCNYSTHVLYHLPKLVKLDTYEVEKNMVELAEVKCRICCGVKKNII